MHRDAKPGKKAAPLAPPPWEIDRINKQERRKRQPLREQPVLDVPMPLQRPPEKEEKSDRGVLIIEPSIVDSTIKPTIIQV